MTRTRPAQPTLDLPVPRTPTLTEQRATTPTAAPAPPELTPGPRATMLRVAGLDYSITATGIAIITQRINTTCTIDTSTIRTKPTPHATLADQYNRLDTIAHAIYHAACQPNLVIIESLSFGSKGQLDRLWAGWWITVGLFVKAGIPVATITPGALKLALTGKGTSDKSVMGGHLRKLWPNLEYRNDNEVDAAGLAHLGAVRLAWNVPTLERHKQVKAEWPTFGLGNNDTE